MLLWYRGGRVSRPGTFSIHMTDNDTILIAGRGPSIYGFDWSLVDCPVMAVSSGIYAVPQGRATHFVSLDEPKYFIEPLVRGGIAWGDDQNAGPWPFWNDPDLVKHVNQARLKPMRYKTIPPEVMDHMPEHMLRPFCKELLNCHHIFGFQPTWYDYSNVRGWVVDTTLEPAFLVGVMGLGGICNSLFFAVQIAHQLGYERLYFAGVDFNGEGYCEHRKAFARWASLARDHDFEWECLTPESAICGILRQEQLA